jgi:hypothetical protein
MICLKNRLLLSGLAIVVWQRLRIWLPGDSGFDCGIVLKARLMQSLTEAEFYVEDGIPKRNSLPSLT